MELRSKRVLFRIKRLPPWNDRGDKGSILKRQYSVEKVGIIQVARGGGPWLVHVQDPTIEDEYLALHWGTLLEGAELAIDNDLNGKNGCVQLTLRNGLVDCKIYRRGILDCPDICKYLKKHR